MERNVCCNVIKFVSVFPILYCIYNNLSDYCLASNEQSITAILRTSTSSRIYKKKLYRNEGANRTTHFACNLNCIEILVGAIKLIFCSSYNVYYFPSTVSDDEEVVTVDYEEGTASVIVIYFMVDIEQYLWSAG